MNSNINDLCYSIITIIIIIFHQISLSIINTLSVLFTTLIKPDMFYRLVRFFNKIITLLLRPDVLMANQKDEL